MIDTDLQNINDFCEKKLNLCTSVKLKTPYRNSEVHGEMKVAKYIVTYCIEKTKKNNCFNIGISKLCCSLCEIYLKNLQKVHNVKFFVKGYHSKTYKKWLFFDDDDLSTRKEVLKALTKSFQAGDLTLWAPGKEIASYPNSVCSGNYQEQLPPLPKIEFDYDEARKLLKVLFQIQTEVNHIWVKIAQDSTEVINLIDENHQYQFRKVTCSFQEVAAELYY